LSVASTYAEALYAAAKAAGRVDAVSADLTSFVDALGTSPDLRRLLESPDVTAAAKKAAIVTVVAPTNQTLANFLRLLIDRGRTADLPEISRAFALKVDDAEGRIAVEAITAIPLPDDLRQSIIAKVQRETGRAPQLTERVDPEVIGGLILRVGGVMLDSSARRHLDAMRRNLSSAPIPVGAESSPNA
jgi:F-type H+-transporting ATPase subunit delta